MKKTIIRVLLVAALAVLTALSLASCDMLPEPILELLGAKTECAHAEVEWVVDTPSTCKLEGVQHSECKACGAVVESGVALEKSEHALEDWATDVEPTCNAKGSRYRRCSVCKSKVETEALQTVDTHKYNYGVCLDCRGVQTESVGITYSSNGDGTCTVTGMGTCTDASLVIPATSPSGETVTAIAANAFLGQSGITWVIIADTVESVGAEAFKGCGIHSATVPAAICGAVRCDTIVSLTVSGGGAVPAQCFMGAPKLSSVTFLDGVTKIGDSAFINCPALGGITMADSVVKIGDSAFAKCESLKGVTIGNGVVHIGAFAFQGCKYMTRIYIPASVKFIGKRAINSPRLDDVTFELTEGWYATLSESATSGNAIASATLESSELAGKLLNAGYVEYYIKRN